MSYRKRIGDFLIEAGVVAKPQINKALVRQKETGERLGRTLEEMGIISEIDIAKALARQFGLKLVLGISSQPIPLSVLELIAPDKAMNNFIFPLKVVKKTLFLAMSNPLDMETQDIVSFQSGLRVVPCVTTPSEIQQAVRSHYPRKASAADDFRRWTILVVDDQDLPRSAIKSALSLKEFKILEGTNGVEGIKIALEEKPHLIIADTLMPRMGGVEMFRALQGNSKTKHIPVIALSSKSSPDEEANLLDLGYFDFLAKPVNPIRIVARVQALIRFKYPPEKMKRP